MTQTSQTPRTDAISLMTCPSAHFSAGEGVEMVDAHFARTLERENAELRAALELCVRQLDVIAQNARTIADPRTNGATDISAVPIDDIENIGWPMSRANAALSTGAP